MTTCPPKHLARDLLLLLLCLLIAACNLSVPGGATPTPLSPEQIQTQVAQTIIAQLTEIAGGDTPTPLGEQPPATLSPTGELPATEAFTPTASPAPATPSPSPLPSPTLPAGDPRSALGPPDFQDHFETADNWAIYSNEHVEMSIEDNHLVMKALNADKWTSWMLAWPVLKNFYQEAVFSPGDCKGLDNYGLIFRAPDDKSGYFFATSCDGQYSLRSWNGTRFSNLIEWTASDALQTGDQAVNRLAVQASGSTITLVANGQVLAEPRNSNFADGGIGLFVAAYETAGFTVTVSEFSYWELP